MRRAWTVALLLGVTSLVLSGCGGGGEGKSSRRRASAGVVVPLRMFGSGAAVKAVVELTLGGHPYYFVVDSGAAGTVIDARVARRLGLRGDGPPREFAPLGCRASTQPLAIRDWRLGRLHLPPSTIFTQTLLIPHALPGIQLAGLLGSDTLSRFGAVTIDFTHRQLILGGAPPTGGRAVPIMVVRQAGLVRATTSVTFDNRRARFLVDTGSGGSVIDSATAARLRLPVVGRSGTATGAVCRTTITPVQVRNWSIAGLRFPKAAIGRVHVVYPSGYLRPGFAGIIGMATLARRGTLTIDYAHSRMILGGAPS